MRVAPVYVASRVMMRQIAVTFTLLSNFFPAERIIEPDSRSKPWDDFGSRCHPRSESPASIPRSGGAGARPDHPTSGS